MHLKDKSVNNLSQSKIWIHEITPPVLIKVLKFKWGQTEKNFDRKKLTNSYLTLQLFEKVIPVRELSYCACSNSWRDFRGFFEDLVSAKYLKYTPSKLVIGKLHSLRRSPYFSSVTVESPRFLFDFISYIFLKFCKKMKVFTMIWNIFWIIYLNMNFSIFEFNSSVETKNWRK